jgi:hypothetical protein
MQSVAPISDNLNTPHPMLGLLQAFLAPHIPPSTSQSGDVHSTPIEELRSPEPIAGPSRLTTDDRIPSSVKGKRRAEPAADRVPVEEDEQTAAQMEADAALAAAMQAEEDGIEARRFLSGVAIR